MKGIDLLEVAQRYRSIPEIWDVNDKWHQKTKKMIKEFIFNFVENVSDYKNIKILNVGSAGYSYELDEKKIFHIDIAYNKNFRSQRAIIGTIEKPPIINDQFDLIICVGSVLNYCDPVVVFQEFYRLLKHEGYVIIEFENSFTFELIGKNDFNKSTAFIETFYNGGREKIWYFSEAFINQLALKSGFIMLNKNRCHIISPLIYRIFNNENFAARFSNLDKFFLKIPFINKFCSNVIYLLKK